MKTVSKYLKPLLKIIKDSGNSITTEEAYERISVSLELTTEELEITTKDGGEPLYKNLTRWARRFLKDTGFLADAKRGVWKLSEKGINYDLENFDIKDIIPNIKTDSKPNNIKPTIQKPQDNNESPVASETFVEEIEFNDSEEEQDEAILKYIQNINPYDFEILSKNILREHGFTELNVTKKSGNNGIDGFGKVRLNPFVSISVAFQSKRFKEAYLVQQLETLGVHFMVEQNVEQLLQLDILLKMR